MKPSAYMLCEVDGSSNGLLMDLKVRSGYVAY